MEIVITSCYYWVEILPLLCLWLRNSLRTTQQNLTYRSVMVIWIIKPKTRRFRKENINFLTIRPVKPKQLGFLLGIKRLRVCLYHYLRKTATVKCLKTPWFLNFREKTRSMIGSRANQRVISTPRIQGYPDLHYISTSHDLVLEYLGWLPRSVYQYF